MTAAEPYKKATLRPKPVVEGGEHDFVRSYMVSRVLATEEDMREPQFWSRLRQQTIDRYKLRTPDGKADIGEIADELHKLYRETKGIKLRLY